MPESSNRSIVSSDWEGPSEHDIELADFQVEPISSSSALTQVRESVFEISQRVILPLAKTFGAANALFFLLSTILKGHPNVLSKAQKLLAEYQIPAVAGTYATLGALDAVGVEEVKVPNRIALSAMEGFGVAAFTLPMFMEILTRFIQLIEQEPRSSNVEIPDWSATLVIASCCALGLIQAMQSDKLKIRAENPEQESSWVTHPYTLIASTAVKAASSLHGVTMAFMEMAQFLHLSSLTPQSALEYDLRWGITLASGAVGGYSGYVLSLPGAEHRAGTRYSHYCDYVASASQFFTLCLAMAANFYLSDNADKTYGDVVQEQTALWAAIIPALIIFINLTQYVWVKSPALLNRFIEDFSYYLESVRGGYIEEAGEGLTLLSNNLLPLYYSTSIQGGVMAPDEYSSSDEDAEYSEDAELSENSEHSDEEQELSLQPAKHRSFHSMSIQEGVVASGTGDDEYSSSGEDAEYSEDAELGENSGHSDGEQELSLQTVKSRSFIRDTGFTRLFKMDSDSTGDDKEYSSSEEYEDPSEQYQSSRGLTTIN